MSSKRLIILGAGGHGKCVAEAAIAMDIWGGICFLDDCWPEIPQLLNGSLLGRTDHLGQIAQQHDQVIVAIGNNTLRQQLQNKLIKEGYSIATVIHPSAVVSPTAVIDAGSVVLALAVLGSHASIGQGCIVNVHTTVDHDVKISDFAHLGIGVRLCAGSTIGPSAWLQAGCITIYQAQVAKDQIVSVGTIVTTV